MNRLSAIMVTAPELIAAAMLAVETRGAGFVEITRDVEDFVAAAGAGDGILLLFIRHTSASLVIQENADPDVRTDLGTALNRLAPADAGWVHDAEGADDMPAHVKTMLTGVSLHIPVRGGALELGNWQGVYVAEHRERSHRREVVLQFLGSRLILGAQVLFGFQFQAVFQETFADLSASVRSIDNVALALMALAIGLLIAPSMQHRIIEGGADTNRIHRVAGLFAGAALLPFGISLGLDVYIVFDRVLGLSIALAVGGLFGALAGLLWFVVGLALRCSFKGSAMSEQEKPTPLSTRIDQMLTEARVIVPGAQALLGFQLAVAFTRAFAELGAIEKLVHLAALCFVALAVVLLMTPAALHRIAFRGEDSNRFLRLGSAFVLAAPLALAFGLAADMQVAAAKATQAVGSATILAVLSFAVLIALWYALPLLLRARLAKYRDRLEQTDDGHHHRRRAR